LSVLKIKAALSRRTGLNRNRIGANDFFRNL
jgi:hypothetical protein